MMEYELEDDMDFTTVVGHLKIFLSKLLENWKIISNEEEGTIVLFQDRTSKNTKQLNQVTQDLPRQDVKEKVENKAVLSVSSKIYKDCGNNDNIFHDDDDDKHKFVEKEVIKDDYIIKETFGELYKSLTGKCNIKQEEMKD